MLQYHTARQALQVASGNGRGWMGSWLVLDPKQPGHGSIMRGTARPTHPPTCSRQGAGPVCRPPGAGTGRGHSCLLQICRVFNFLTALCALLCALAFGMAIAVRGEATSKVRGGMERVAAG